MTTDQIKEEVQLSLTVAKGSFYKKPEFGHRFKELARDEEFMVSDEDQGFRIVKTAMAATSDKKEEK